MIIFADFYVFGEEFGAFRQSLTGEISIKFYNVGLYFM